MLIKRSYDWTAPTSAWPTRVRPCLTCRTRGKVVNEAGDGVMPCPDCVDGRITEKIPPVKSIDVGRLTDQQHFSPNVIQTGVFERWLVMTSGYIILEAEQGRIRYQIVRAPGYYCCHCRESIPDAGVVLSTGQTVGQVHVARYHPNQPSPDPNNPSGYERAAYFDCVRG
jgi:hypothetical protein